MVKLTNQEILGNRGFHAAETVILNQEETFRHTHEFYEIFITREGSVYHHWNQSEELIFQNTLWLVQPQDVHSFRKGASKSVHFLNLAVSREKYDKAQWIWSSFCKGKEEERKNHVRLQGNLGQSIVSRILYLISCMTSQGEIPADTIILSLLLDTFSCLQNEKEDMEVIPAWLENITQIMRKRENYLEGLERFVELSGKTQEHLTRMMKRYYKTTPTAYINSLRLEEAALLLRTTEKSVLEIMLDCGFQNVSYFNQRFKEEYGIPPARYRKINRLIVNPD